MKTQTTPLTLLLAMAALLLLTTGCDLTTPVQEDPDPDRALSLAQSTHTGVAVSENLLLLDQFENPLAGLSEDGGLYGDANSESWTGQDADLPAWSLQAAREFGAQQRFARRAAAAPEPGSRMMAALHLQQAFGERDAPGDTIYVEYFEGPDTTGINALVWEDPAEDLVRYVSRLEFMPLLGQVVRRDQEILIDMGGTLENPDDDLYHRFDMEEEWFGGEVDTGSLAPISGQGPMEPGVRVRAFFRVEDPRLNPLQEWTESELVLDMGDFADAEDDILYSLDNTVHWRSDAEHRARLSDPEGGAMEPGTVLLALGDFTAAPSNPLLESIRDTVRVDMGELDDDGDDLLHEMRRLSVSDGTAFDGGSPRNWIRILPEEPASPGEDPCGAEVWQDIWYPEDWWLVRLIREADIHCDGSGTLHEIREFQNGTSYEMTITWDGQGGATLVEERADGTLVEGSWSESTGEYSVQTTYPEGNDPVSRDQHGTSTEGFTEAWDIYQWQDGRPDETWFTREGDSEDYTASGHREYGDLYEEFTLGAVADEFAQGSWSRNDGAHGQFTLESLEGGGAHLFFSAADPGAEGGPSVEGEIWFAPDGSGTGTITVTQWGITATYDIEFGPDGWDLDIGDGLLGN